jgi:hypothetical protein
MAKDTRERVVDITRTDPTLTTQEIADRAGISRQRVALILEGLGYQRVWMEWPPKGKAVKR